MKLKKLFYVATLFIGGSMFAQETQAPTSVITGTYKGLTIPLRDFQTFVPSQNSDEVTVFPNMAVISPEENNTTTVIQNLQTESGKIATYSMEQNFIGASQNESGFLPPDPTGAAGPNHYVHSVNSIVKIFDKSGGLLVGPVSLSSFLGNGSNNGDPIVLYDQLADRWIVSEFGAGTNTLSIGVSETNDPTGAFNVWDFTHPAGFPDYPHYGIWHDGYYGTVNLPGVNGNSTIVLERDVMLAGGANPQMAVFTLPGNIYNPNQVKSAEPANLLGTDIDTGLPGYITYLQDDAWGGVDFDHLKVWEIYMDWANINNSTISDPLEIPTDPFDAGELFGNGNGAIHQPNTSQRLAGHGGIVSFAANYRSFEDHNSWLVTFNTFIDENETGGIRWIELRNDDVNVWDIFQEGTYSIADGHSRLMSSAAIDANGNIAMAYTTASTELAVSLRYTGRFDGDPLGEMTLAETVIIDGPGVRTNTNRYGDYAHMTMDPDNFTFWFTSDYFSSNNQWRSQVAAITINGNLADDVGVINVLEPENGVLTSTETIEVNIRNFGSSSQSNIPLELRVNGSLVASETYSGSIDPSSSETYSFTQTVDLSTAGETYEIEVTTDLGGDEYNENDSYTKNVTHLLGDNVGALGVSAPSSGSELGVEEITMIIKNIGLSPQSNFDVQYSINGDTPVIETFTGTIGSEETASYSFTQTSDFSELGVYNVTVKTLLAGDQNPSDDEATTVVENNLCQPEGDCSLGHGLQLFNIAEINNPSGCEGYADFTDLLAVVDPGSTNDLTLTTGYGDQWVTVFIDFNDNSIFEFPGEVVVNNHVMADGEGPGSYTETIDLEIPADAALGEHIMRVRTNWKAPVVNGCENYELGETEDYSVNIGVLGVEDYEISNSNLVVTTLPNNNFDVILNTEYDSTVYLGVYNMLGQQVGFNKRVPKINNTYKLNIDMANMAAGVYVLRMGGIGTTSYKTARIIVIIE